MSETMYASCLTSWKNGRFPLVSTLPAADVVAELPVGAGFIRMGDWSYWAKQSEGTSLTQVERR